jgi:hypothetical protein
VHASSSDFPTLRPSSRTSEDELEMLERELSCRFSASSSPATLLRLGRRRLEQRPARATVISLCFLAERQQHPNIKNLESIE